jgi:hypothetical protein
LLCSTKFYSYIFINHYKNILILSLKSAILVPIVLTIINNATFQFAPLDPSPGSPPEGPSPEFPPESPPIEEEPPEFGLPLESSDFFNLEGLSISSLSEFYLSRFALGASISPLD